jgi:hypothetical protein
MISLNDEKSRHDQPRELEELCVEVEVELDEVEIEVELDVDEED